MVIPGRIDIGIPGMNEILHGGLPRGLTVLLSGEAGTGKSIFAYQFLYRGLRQDEPGVLLELEDYPARVRMNMAMFGWDVKPYEDRKSFAIIDCFTGGETTKKEKYVVRDPTDIPSIIEALRTAVKDVKAERVVVDSISTLYLIKPEHARQAIIQIKRLLVSLGCTSLLIWQKGVASGNIPTTTYIEHIADGIIRFRRSIKSGELKRYVLIEKMRQTNHSRYLHEIDIVSGKGLVIVGPIERRREDFSLPREVSRKIIESRKKTEEEIP